MCIVLGIEPGASHMEASTKLYLGLGLLPFNLQ